MTNEYQRKIVLLRESRCPTNTTICDSTTATFMRDMGYVPCSEVIAVEFPPLPPEEFVKAAVAVLDEKIGDVRAKAQQAVNELEEHRKALLAITYQPQEQEDDQQG